MGELARMEYLAALDIECYMPRLALVNAPISKLCELPCASAFEQKTDAQVGNVSVAATDDRQPATECLSSAFTAPPTVPSAQDVFASLGVQTAEISKPIDCVDSAPSEEAEVTSEGCAPVEAFSLSVWLVDDLMVIDSRDVTAAMPTDRLLVNLLLALGYQLPANTSAEVLRWPLVENDTSHNDEASARAMLQAFLEVKFEYFPIRKLLLLGQSASQFILPADINYQSSLYCSVPIPDFSVDAVVGVSLTEMLEDPLSKRKLWDIVRSFSRF